MIPFYKSLLIITVLTGLSLSLQASDGNRPLKASSVRYASGAKEGRIGVTDEAPVDNPADNIFHVAIPAPVCDVEKVWLVYELEGVEDHTSVSRSINDQLAVGGYLVKKRRGWATQRERIDASWLRQGDNVIRFTVPEGALHSYRIRNVTVEVETPSPDQPEQSETFIINQPASRNYYDNSAYVKGFIPGNDQKPVRVKVGGKPALVFNGEFEVITPILPGGSCTLDVEVVHADGQTSCHTVEFSGRMSADYSYPLSQEVYHTEAFFTAGRSDSVALHGAGVRVDSGSLKTASFISITTLRDVDIPALDAGMVNVTAYHFGFRFLPHGTAFLKQAGLTIPFDKNKIPDGYTEKDLKTYYFDEQAHHWIAVPADTVLLEAGTILSRTAHFTDYINAIIKVPESPEAEAYNSTSMKGIKAANPTAAVNLINPPQANNTGSASLGYIINIPAGRNGMQPQLGIHYNSGGGNGWLGLGWNLTIPSISIDTRWGVPRYDAAKETETYSMNGEQLSPVTHRSALQNRAAEKQFYPRVEGAFNKIIRHGSTPADYWWEVTDKSGTRYSYGGSNNSLDKNSVLRTDEFHEGGNIAEWCLTEVRDLNGNYVTYQYVKEANIGLPNGTVFGHQIYIDRITYTHHASAAGKYAVLFTRDREMTTDFTQRQDVSIMGNLGFKQVTADLLSKIEVQFDGKNIRSYGLNYTQGAFFKTLLTGISEYDAGGKLFTTHQFDYYNDVGQGAGFKPLTQPQDWTPQDDGVKGNLAVTNGAYSDKASALGGTKSSEVGGGITVTVGPATGSYVAKSLSVGGSVGYSESRNDGLLSVIDINGDGLPDKVFMKGSTMYYRPNQSGTSDHSDFGARREIALQSTNGFYKEKSTTWNFGLEANFFAFVGLGRSKTTSVTSVYFAEVNGDQLPDLMVNGKVYFNHIDPNTGDPVFTESSGDTPSPIQGTGSVDGNIVDADPQELEKTIDENPLHDVVRMWRAPYSGNVQITAPVRLLESQDAERAAAPADGVGVSIQHNGEELWKARIPATDYGQHVPTGVGSVMVQKGDRFYFRVQSVFNGSYDSVQWSPAIQYPDQDLTLKDANRKPYYSFSSQKDFILTSKQSIDPPINGRVRIEGDFIKPVTSDNVRAEILQISAQHDTTVVWTSDYAWSDAKTDPVSKEITVDTTQLLTFRVSASTNIDWSAIQWHPHLYYVASNDSRYAITINADGKPEPLIDFYPIPEYTVYADVKKISTPWIASKDTSTLSITPHLEFANLTAQGQVVFSIKKPNRLLYKGILTIINGVAYAPNSITLGVKKQDSLYMEYHVLDGEHLAAFITNSTVGISVDGGMEKEAEAGLYTTFYAENDLVFGPLYRHWGQFAYNGNRDKADVPIVEGDLKLSDALKNSPAPGDISQPGDLNSKGAYNPATEKFIVFVPMGKEKNWRGYDAHTSMNATVISSSRLGQDDLTIASVVPGGGARGINKISKSTSSSFTAGAPSPLPIGGSVGYNKSDGTTNLLADFMDMNGDRYPDIVTDNRIQYTTAQGGLEENYVSHDMEAVHQTITSSEGFSSGSYVSSEVKGGRKTRTDVGSAQVSGGINGSFGTGVNYAAFSWMDINGDGLPDKVYAGGDVALNLGYHFAPKESWKYADISRGNSKSKSAGLSISMGNGSQSASFSAGLGLALSENYMTGLLEDVNGDGLVDEVLSSDGGVQVKLNKGNGFDANFMDWSGASQLNSNSTSSQSANVAFTGCFPVWLLRICLNPNVNVGTGVSRDLKKLTDMDGDGYPDFVTSDIDARLSVSRSTIGRTNLLRGVTRPMGATFTLNYQRMGNTYDMPHSTWVLGSVKVFDGFAGDGADTLLTSFAYENGKYDRNEREFYGFNKVTTESHDTQKNNAVYTRVAQTFASDNYYEKGLLLTETMTDGAGNRFVEKENSYQLKDTGTGANLPASIKSDAAGKAFPALVETSQKFYEGQSTAGKSTGMTYGYDTKGNVITYADLGDEGTEDDLSASITYHNVASQYIIGTPQSITVKGNGTTYRRRESTINQTTGEVTQIRQYLTEGEMAVHDMEYDAFGNLKKITRPKNSKDQRLSFDYVYDDQVYTYTVKVSNSYGYSSEASYDFRFGQVLSSKDLNGNQIQYELDDLGRVVKITGPYEKVSGNGYTLKFEYHPEAAVPWAWTKHFDPAFPKNDLETSIFVDGLGRVLQTKKDAAIYQGENTADKEQMVVSGRVLFDAFGRTTKAYYPGAEDKGNTGVINLGFDAVTPTASTYDVLNRTLAVTLPDGATTSTAYSFENDRNGKKQFSTKTTDANGKQTEQFTDVRGRVSSVKNYTSANAVWTSFKYNAINEQIEATDDLNHTTFSAYDNFGRRVSRKHPDAGTTNYTYDLAGNLSQLETANLIKAGGAIQYAYNFERLESITYPQSPENNVNYTYGAAGATDNRAGRIVLQEDATGAQEFFYGPLGEVVKNIRTIVIPQFGDQTYTTAWTYDTWNRLTSMAYADGEQVDYTYNVGGLLLRMDGKKKNATFSYVKQLGYDKFEQRLFLAYGNGTKTTYNYEPDRRRLKTMTAQTAAKRSFMDNVYTYDKVNNILNLTNNAPVPATNLMGGSSEYNYSYDDLYRLTSASGSYKGANDDEAYNLSMNYNSVGDITQKTQNHTSKGNVAKKTTYDNAYTYGTDQPHAPIHIGKQTFSYDANGNQTGFTDDVSSQRRNMMWDEENRIRAISDNGAFYHYIYDAAGERVLKGQSTGQRIFVNGQWKAGSGQMGNYTVYVNPYLVLKSGGYTKHFYIEGQRIVSKLGGGWNNTGSATQAGGTQVDYGAKGKRLLDGIVKNLKFLGADGSVLTAGKSGKVPPGQVNGSGNVTEAFRYFYHPDHLGSTSYVTDASGEVYQHLEYFAFGETFVEEHSNTSRIPYLFNGKELDEETGLYNYGLRYYDPRMSVWLSVDPMAEKYASSTPYAYTLNNPLNLIDPNGMEAKPTPIHQSIIESAQRWAYNESTVGWTTGDIVKWKTNGGNVYLFERKAQFVGYYKNVIKDAAKTYDIPEFLLAGVAYTEFGGDPMWIDDAADATRSFDWGGPDWVDNNLTMTSHPDKTSMGNLSIQIRTAAEALGYDPKNLSSDDRAKIIESLKDPVQNIYIAAKHLSDLRNVDAKGKASSQMTKGDIKNAATRYNRGSGLSLNKILQNLSYGKSIYKHEKEINDALNK